MRIWIVWFTFITPFPFPLVHIFGVATSFVLSFIRCVHFHARLRLRSFAPDFTRLSHVVFVRLFRLHGLRLDDVWFVRLRSFRLFSHALGCGRSFFRLFTCSRSALRCVRWSFCLRVRLISSIACTFSDAHFFFFHRFAFGCFLVFTVRLSCGCVCSVCDSGCRFGSNRSRFVYRLRWLRLYWFAFAYASLHTLRLLVLRLRSPPPLRSFSFVRCVAGFSQDDAFMLHLRTF